MRLAAIALSVAIGIAGATVLAQPADNWIISETTSPVDYTPMVIATTYSRRSADGATMQFSIHCRGGRTEMVVAGPGLSRRPDEYQLSYRVNDGPPVPLAAAASASGNGVALGGDVGRLLRSLPETGQLAIQLTTRQGAAHDGTFSLDGLKAVRDRVIRVCR